MNEKQNPLMIELVSELSAQNTALAMMMCDLRNEIRQLRGIVLAIGDASGHPVSVEDHTDPNGGVKQGIEDYADLLAMVRRGLKENPSG